MPATTTDIVLVPGLWLDGSTWDQVTPHLEAAGHRAHPLTLPGMRPGDDRRSVTLDDQVGAIVGVVDDAAGPVVLVGHSMGCAVVWAAVDARVDAVAHAVLVGGFPTADGARIAPWFEPVDGELPLPDLSEFDEADLRDLDEQQLADFRANAIPAPGGVITAVQRLGDERRYDVPVTAVCPEFTSDDLRGWVESGEAPVAELARIRDVRYVDVPTGHWPQLTKPEQLAQAILGAVEG